MVDSCAAVSVGVHSPRITFSANTVYNERRPGIASAGASPPLGSSGSSTPDRPSTGKAFISLGAKKSATFSEFDRSSPKVRKVRSASKLATSFFRKQATGIFPGFGRSASSPGGSTQSSADEGKDKKKSKKMKKGEKRALSDGQRTVASSPDAGKPSAVLKEPATPKRTAERMAEMSVSAASTAATTPVTGPVESKVGLESPMKRAKPQANAKTLPMRFQQCETTDLVVLVADMLGELVRLNDGIPLTGRGLTRFHSRAPPMISIEDYLQRLALHLTLQPSILLSMVYYIDILTRHYPPFTISSLTVHRFLITAATVATKGLCDAFLTNTFYARVGGVSLMELNMLELEFLVRVGWRIVPKPELLDDYYWNLVKRMGGRFVLGEEGVGRIAPCTLTSPDTGEGFEEGDVVIPENYEGAEENEVEKDEAEETALPAEQDV